MENHNAWLRTVGLDETADRNENNYKNQKYQLKLRKIFNKAENLSKNGNLKESNEIIYELIDNEKPDATAPMYWRLAINHRKLKEYQEEKNVLERFLKYEQPRYGGNMWKDKFQDRINKVNEKIK